eukprot:m.55709 g.55709  ORF g.55709 m.55709 type:complete len:69 (+) comp11142_c0_seq2:932-1138(+)
MEGLLAGLFMDRPENPVDYMIDLIQSETPYSLTASRCQSPIASIAPSTIPTRPHSPINTHETLSHQSV